ncbi:MAG: AraC family transcriptional regulator ligand-binding domain-containing protein [Myxococcota bacterium]
MSASSTNLGSRIQLSGAWTRFVLEAFGAVGLDTEALCREVGEDQATLTDPTVRVPRDTAGRLWRAAVAASGDRFIGLHAGAAVRREPTHVIELLLLKGATLGDGILAGIRFQSLVAHGEVATLEEGDGLKRVRLHRVEGELPITPHELEFIAATTTTYFRAATAGRFRLAEVTFAHPFRGMSEEYERVFRCPVRFGSPHTELSMTDDTWNLPLSTGDPTVHRALAELASALTRDIELAGFLASASQAIGRCLLSGRADVESVAHELHMSSRSLQRRLKEEGTTFRALRDHTRRSIVIEGIEQKRPVAEIARRAGIANERGVSRALRRWRNADNS